MTEYTSKRDYEDPAYEEDKQAEPHINKISELVDELHTQACHQREHNAPITDSIIKMIEAIQTKIAQSTM
jgi:hypothetical protein